MRLPRPARLAPLALAAALLVTACGDAPDEEGSGSATTAVTDSTTSDAAADGTAEAPAPTVDPNVPPKPEVKLPDGEVTELTITDLTDGSGDGAEEGDVVLVHYVGVRSEDGSEFDNSYERGTPYPVTLGAGQVIPGWEQGLLGAKAGGQRQLDIPADLAYGDSPRGDVIQPGDALSFVLDVVSVIAGGTESDEPAVSVEPGKQIDSVETQDLEEGTGESVRPGQTVAFDFLLIQADTGETLRSSWQADGVQQTIPYDEVQLPPTLVEVFSNVKVGTLRQVGIPFAEASEIFQLPADTDVVLVLRVNGIF
jgi:peptidylprolyl isomerase